MDRTNLDISILQLGGCHHTASPSLFDVLIKTAGFSPRIEQIIPVSSGLNPHPVVSFAYPSPLESASKPLFHQGNPLNIEIFKGGAQNGHSLCNGRRANPAHP
jgi:hypothetical protein